jgi:hypothetical protein
VELLQIKIPTSGQRQLDRGCNHVSIELTR